MFIHIRGPGLKHKALGTFNLRYFYKPPGGNDCDYKRKSVGKKHQLWEEFNNMGQTGTSHLKRTKQNKTPKVS